MVAHIGTVAFLGIEARLVDVQVHVASGTSIIYNSRFAG